MGRSGLFHAEDGRQKYERSLIAAARVLDLGVGGGRTTSYLLSMPVVPGHRLLAGNDQRLPQQVS